MAFKLQPLPFADDALEPHMSRETVFYHYDKHHRGYVDKLNKSVSDSQKNKSLEDLILTADGKVFNFAAQVWNHDFFWQSLAAAADPPHGAPNNEPDDETFNTMLKDSFGGIQEFCNAFKQAALGRFGSGWAWLVYNPHKGAMECVSSANADTPLGGPQTPLLTLDVWEHAYYIDYRNERERFVDEFLAHLINWPFAIDNLHAALHAGELRRYA